MCGRFTRERDSDRILEPLGRRFPGGAAEAAHAAHPMPPSYKVAP